MKTVDKHYEFKDGVNASLKLIITSVTGRSLYDLECHSRGYDDPNFDYSGDFECRLMPLYTQTSYSTLFTYDPQQSRDWESRARFLAINIVGECAKYPEFGLVRHFHLRGMGITLSMNDVKLSEPAKNEQKNSYSHSIIASFEFNIEVNNDPKATSEIDAPIKQDPKYGKCNTSFVSLN